MNIRLEFAKQMSKIMVSDMAPEETEFFDEILLSSDKNKNSSDVYLGFGGDDAVMLFTTTIFYGCAKCIVDFVWDNCKDSAGNLIRDCSKSIQEALFKWFDKKLKGHQDLPPIHFSEQTIEKIVRAALKAPDASKLSKEQQIKIKDWIHLKFSAAS